MTSMRYTGKIPEHKVGPKNNTQRIKEKIYVWKMGEKTENTHGNSSSLQFRLTKASRANQKYNKNTRKVGKSVNQLSPFVYF